MGVRNVVIIEVILLKLFNIGFKFLRNELRFLKFLVIFLNLWFVWYLWVMCYFLVIFLVMIKEVCVMLLMKLYIGGLFVFLEFCGVGLFVMIFLVFSIFVIVCG